jgi:hypothetical protein
VECYTNLSSLGERGHYEAINLVLLNTTVFLQYSASYAKHVVYTNDDQILNNEFCWNDDNQTCEVYLITFEDSQVQINQMTDFIKEKIKQGYNIHQLYDAGKFVPKEISPSAE